MTARFIVLYGIPADPAAFERYYRDVHIPLSRHLPRASGGQLLTASAFAGSSRGWSA
jgi:uncharacterized protein (TIGR02118 family)